MNNKRADISSVTVTILSLMLFGVIFGAIAINKASIEKEITPVYFADSGYAMAKSLEVSTKVLLTESFLNSYQKFLNENSFLESSSDFSALVNSEFKGFLLGKTFTGRVGDESLLDVVKKVGTITNKDIYAYSGEGKTEEQIDEVFGINRVKVGKDGAKLEFKNWVYRFGVLDGETDSLRVDYTGDIVVKVLFKEFELPNFEEIKAGYDDCKELGDANLNKIKECVGQRFSRFDVSVLEDTENSLVGVVDDSSTKTTNDPTGNIGTVSGAFKKYKIVLRLESKNQYYINKEMKKIKFNLVFQN